MKAIKIIGLALLTFVFAGSVSAQKAVTSTTNAVEREYFKDVKTLKTYFIGSEIPASFPKYDKSKSEDENKRVVFSWMNATENKSLLSPIALEKLEKRKAKR